MTRKRLTSGGLRRRTAQLKDRAAEKARSAADSKRTELTERSARMHEIAADRAGSRKRGALAAVVGFAALAGMFQLVSANVLAVNFTTMNSQFQLYSNYLDAQQAAGYLDPTSKQNGSNVGAAELGIKTAALGGLCGIASETLPVLGTWSLKLTAGQKVATSFTGTSIPTPPGGTLSTTGAAATLSVDGTTGKINLVNSTPGGIITANELYVNATALGGYGNKISGLNLGQNAVDVSGVAGVTAGTGAQAPTAGNFGLYANQLNIGGLSGSAYGLNLAGQITLPQLSISVVQGAKTQADC